MMMMTLVPLFVAAMLPRPTQAFFVPRRVVATPPSLLFSSSLYSQQDDGDAYHPVAREWEELYAPTVVISSLNSNNNNAASPDTAAEVNWSTQWQELQALNAGYDDDDDAHTTTSTQETHHHHHYVDKKKNGVHALTPDMFPGEFESDHTSSSRQSLQANPTNVKPWKPTASSVFRSNSKALDDEPMIITRTASEAKPLRLAQPSPSSWQQQQQTQQEQDEPMIITQKAQEEKPLRLAQHVSSARQPQHYYHPQQDEETPMIITHTAHETKPLRLAKHLSSGRQPQHFQQDEETPMIITHTAHETKPLRLAKPSAAAWRQQQQQDEETPMIITHTAHETKPLRLAEPSSSWKQEQSTVRQDEYMGPVMRYHSGGWHDAIAESWDDVELSRRAAATRDDVMMEPDVVESFSTPLQVADTMVAEPAVVSPAAMEMPHDHPSNAESSADPQSVAIEESTVEAMPAFAVPTEMQDTTAPKIPPPPQGFAAVSTVPDANQVVAAAYKAPRVIQDTPQDNASNSMQALADAWTQRNKAPAQESSSSMPPLWSSSTTTAAPTASSPKPRSSWPQVQAVASRVVETAQPVVREEESLATTPTPDSSLRQEESTQDLAQVSSLHEVAGSLETPTPYEEQQQQQELVATLTEPTATSQAADQVEAAINALLESDHDEVMLEEAEEQFEDAVQALMTAIDDKVEQTQLSEEITTTEEQPDENPVAQDFSIEDSVQEEEEQEAVEDENLAMQDLFVENTVPEEPRKQAPKPRKVIWNREFAASLPTENFCLTMNFQNPDDDDAARRSAAMAADALKRLRRAVESVPVPPFRDLKKKRALFAGAASTLLATFVGVNTIAAMVNPSGVNPEPVVAAPLEEPIGDQAQVFTEEETVMQMQAEEPIVTEAEAFQPRLAGDMSEM